MSDGLSQHKVAITQSVSITMIFFLRLQHTVFETQHLIFIHILSKNIPYVYSGVRMFTSYYRLPPISHDRELLMDNILHCAALFLVFFILVNG